MTKHPLIVNWSVAWEQLLLALLLNGKDGRCRNSIDDSHRGDRIIGIQFIQALCESQAFRLLNPSYTNYVEAKITQPLLSKGAGWFYNRSLIYIARNNKDFLISVQK